MVEFHNIDWLARFPVDGTEGRSSKRLYRITSESALRVIHGSKYPILMRFFVSNDSLHMGELVIPVGMGSRASEVMSHKGDAVIYIETGPITFYMTETRETLVAHEGEAMYIPENTHYYCINYTGGPVKGIFMIAPNL